MKVQIVLQENTLFLAIVYGTVFFKGMIFYYSAKIKHFLCISYGIELISFMVTKFNA